MEFKRHRRLRSSQALRDLVKETELGLKDLIYPIFVSENVKDKKEIPSMPGIYQHSLESLEGEIRKTVDLGVKAVLFFGIPAVKDEVGSSAYDDEGIVQRAIRMTKEIAPDLIVIADTCLCEFTSHGHCGVLDEGGQVLNDESLDLLSRTAVSQARAGADIIAPSNAMDGFVAHTRQALDTAGFANIPILAYSVKYASSFYGPFRDAAESAPQEGDRKSYQMPIHNAREAMSELEADIAQGADLVMVKPGLAYMDIISKARALTNLPLVAYNVSGEYSMVKAAGEKGWIDEEAIALEILTGMKRAGADLVISYHALDVARSLKG